MGAEGDVSSWAALESWLEKWGTLAVAIAALIQPYIYFLWKMAFRRGRIRVHSAARLEVGYSDWGPTLGLNGTMQCIHRECFVKAVRLDLVRLKDGAAHAFEWVAFRSQRISVGGKEEGTIELPVGVLVTPQQPYRFNIMFSDIETRDRIRERLQYLQDLWQATIPDNIIEVLTAALPVDATKQAREAHVSNAVGKLYATFQTKREHVETYTFVQRQCYWEAGKYTLRATVEASSPDIVFQQSWEFELTEDDADGLRNNAIRTLMNACNQLGVKFNFANPLLRPIERSG